MAASKKGVVTVSKKYGIARMLIRNVVSLQDVPYVDHTGRTKTQK